MLGNALQRIDEFIEQSIVVNQAKAEADKPIKAEILVGDTAKRREPKRKKSFSLVSEDTDGGFQDCISNHGICFWKPALGRTEVADNRSAVVDGIEECKSLQLAVTVEGEEFADVDLVVENGRPCQKRHLAVLDPEGVAPSHGNGFQLLAVEGSHRTLRDRVAAAARAVDGGTEISFPRPVEIVAIERDVRLDSHCIHAKAAQGEYFGDGPRSLPEANIVSRFQEALDEIFAAPVGRYRIGQNKGGVADLFISKKAILVTEIVQIGLEGRRISQRETSILPQQPQARFYVKFRYENVTRPINRSHPRDPRRSKARSDRNGIESAPADISGCGSKLK
ncbi:MAG TPA: hypothetical protein VG271_07415 [Beijerinckiaceae bacterium]|nr:hypothetical protein [Beijerinckiaceae bacterium]